MATGRILGFSNMVDNDSVPISRQSLQPALPKSNWFLTLAAKEDCQPSRRGTSPPPLIQFHVLLDFYYFHKVIKVSFFSQVFTYLLFYHNDLL